MPSPIGAAFGRLAILVLACVQGSALAHESAPPARFQADCERLLPPTSIQVKAEPSEVLYDFSLGVEQLTAKAKSKSGATQTTLGLTESQFQLQSQMTGDVLQDSQSKLYCTRPQIRVTVKVGPQRVYIGKEFPQGSCAFWEIAQHELRHVQANQDRVEYVADKLHKELLASYGNRVFYGSHGDLSQALSRHLNDEWLPWAQALYEQVMEVHKQIDSPAEYARNRTMCDGEVVRILAKYRDS